MKARTKWSILHDRLDEAQAVVNQLRAQLDGLDNTPCGLTCTGCGQKLDTEGDFARHFIVPDSRYLNLGDCPNSPRVKAVDFASDERLDFTTTDVAFNRRANNKEN